MSDIAGGGASLEGGAVQKSLVSNFVNHVFDFGDDSKKEIMNIIQYSLISVIPLIVLNKSVHHLIPESNTLKGSLELSLEIVGQLSMMLVGLLIIDRVITFIPTYSGEDYKKASLLTFVLPFLMILLSLQTKLGEKANILYNRALNKWNGRSGFENFEEEDEETTNDPNIRKSQPIANMQKVSQRSETANPRGQAQNTQLPPPMVSSNRESRPELSGVPAQHSAQSQQQPMMGPDAYGGGAGFSAFGAAY